LLLSVLVQFKSQFIDNVGVRIASIRSSNIIVGLRPYVVVILVVISRTTRTIKAACADALWVHSLFLSVDIVVSACSVRVRKNV